MAFTVTTYRDPVGVQEKHLLEVATAWASGKGSIKIDSLEAFKVCLIRERTWFARDHPALNEVPPLMLEVNPFGKLGMIEINTPGSGRLLSIT